MTWKAVNAVGDPDSGRLRPAPLFAPPCGIDFFSACAIGRTNPDDSLWRIWPYIAALVISLLIIAAIPRLSIGFL